MLKFFMFSLALLIITTIAIISPPLGILVAGGTIAILGKRIGHSLERSAQKQQLRNELRAAQQ